MAAHCHGKAGIKAALDAGCKTIEHGTYLDEELATSMKSKGAILGFNPMDNGIFAEYDTCAQ